MSPNMALYFSTLKFNRIFFMIESDNCVTSGPENNKFLNKTIPKRKISFVNIYGKLQ